ncbi:SLC13 family permease [Desertibaculum subflavum]|uniref:SLC13 family permease n=1 Tax=Desertibaculum subflavum TaxID=2268458 RepID=UPI000E668254
MALTTAQILALVIFVATLAAFAWDRIRYDVVALGALIACVLAGLVKPDDAFAGFGNPAVITVAAVLVLSHALGRSGVIDIVGQALGRVATTPLSNLVLLCGLGAVLSAFMNNVGALAIMMPVAIAAARRLEHSPALILMPLSFATMMGGMTTLIGTPPNLLAAGFRERYGEAPFDFFAFAPVGLAITLGGIALMAAIARFVLPRDREGERSAMEQFDIGHYVTEVKLPEKSELIGKTPREIEGEYEDKLAIISLQRHGLRLRGRFRNTKLRAGDDLMLQVGAELLQELVRKEEVELVAAHTTEGEKPELAQKTPVETAEVVVVPNAWIQGATARSLQLRARYNVNLLALSRHGRPISQRVRDTSLSAGDVLLLEGEPDSLPEAIRALGCLPLANRKIAFQPFRVVAPVVVFGLAIVLVVLDLLSAPIAFVLGVLGMLALRLMPVRDMYDAIDWPVIVLLGAMIPVGGALETSGVAELVANQVAWLGQGWPDRGVLALVLVVTMIVTPMLNNAATVIVMAPIAIGIAQSIGVHPDAFLMAVAIGASCDFLTPFGHQNNTLILAPGGYRFADYWRLGMPLDFVVIGVAVALLPMVFPLR